MMMMMKPKFECENKDNGDGDGDGDGKELLRDIEELSKALYLDNTSFKPSTLSSVNNRSKSAEKARLSKSQLNSTPRFVSEDLLLGDKKLSSKWNWKKPLKALTHIGSQKFVCCFNLHVHSIDGLPLSFDGSRLCVQWKRKNIILQTCLSRVFQGAAEFDETLTHRCSVYGSSTASGRSVKYESKCFLIYTSVVGEPEHDIGKHQVDLTRLLPLSLEELWGDKSSGKWSTRFKLAGKALGASLNVSFSYQVMKDELIGFGSNNVKGLNPSSHDNVVGFGPSNSDIKLRQAGCFPCELQHNRSILRSHSDDVVLSNEAMLNSGSGFSNSITFLYQKLDEENFSNSTWADLEHLGPSESSQGSNLYESDETEFSFSEGVETLEGDSLELDLTGIQIVDLSATEIINVDEIIKDDDMFVDKIKRCDSQDTVCSSCVNEKEMADNSKHNLSMSCVNLPYMKIEDLVPETSEFLDQEHYLSVKSNYKMAKKSHSLDDIIDSVASDFLKSLALESDSFRSSCDGDPLSPREQLLRQFEKEALASGKFTFDFDEVEEELREDTIRLNCEDCAMDSGLSLISGAAEEGYARENHSLIERRKAKILEDLETDSLMQQWGLDERDFENSLKTWSGGFGSPIELSDEEPYILPSIGEELDSFVQTKSGGFLRSMCPSLFRNAKNCGNLIIHASNPVILPAKMGNDILEILQHMASARVEKLYDFIFKLMPLQDITGKSIKHIVQNADTNKEAPERQESWQHVLFEEFQCSYLTDRNKCLDSLSLEAIAPMAINKIEALLIEGLRIQSGMSNEEAPTLERHYGEINNDLEGLMGLSVKLDQWLRLDSGIIQGEHNLEQILKILKAHNSKITELENEGLKNAADKAKIDCRKRRYFENNITVAYTIQHRDPLRNYEAVGVPMLVLSQVERVDINAMEKDDGEFVEDVDIDEETPQSRFKIKEIHLAGVLAKGGNRQVWGSASQQQSGLRWLLASGMCNSTVNRSSSKSKEIIVRPSSLFTNKLMNQDILWSISCVNSNMKNNNAYIRNPDIIFPK